MSSSPRWTPVLVGLAIPLVALVAAGCGSASSSLGVASLGGAHTTTTGAPAGNAGAGGSSPGSALVLNTGNGLKFAQCMRAHGVPNFPDPSSNGSIQVGPSSGVDKGSPKFQAALQACQKVLPNGGRPSPQQLAKMRQGALAFSACMRRHGVPDFPDPDFSGGGIGVRIHIQAGGDLNPQSPVFQAAQQACQGHLPFGKTGAGSAGGK
jgi:hypothetical protein